MVLVSSNIQPTTQFTPATSAGNSVVNENNSIKVHSTSKSMDIDKNSSTDIDKLVNDLNQQAQKESVNISFGYDKELNQVYINVTDKDSGKVIRKLPSRVTWKITR
ncbi:MAG: hypothetical protein DSZ06_01025 [Sulfurospirillum sp.]|nr:MAG: hypothetical protein DSZ06_01025 [Sulfurospirillum sp.]